VVIDGSNVLKHGGGKPKLGNLVGLVACVEESLQVCVHPCVCVCTSICVCVYVHLCVCVPARV
jgi:hypothetical protein